LNQDEVNAQELRNRLISFFKNRTQREIFIRADGALPYAVVAETMAVVKNAGIHKIGLVTLPPDEAKQ
jgi:biopolymer transport protein TolR